MEELMKDAVKMSSAVCHRSSLSEKTSIVQHAVMWCDIEAVHRHTLGCMFFLDG